MTTGNGQRARFSVSYSGKIVKVIQELRFEAFLKGQQSRFDAAWDAIMERLQADPWAFGEVIQPYPHLKMKEHVGSVHPITVVFGIHEELPMVVISKVHFAIFS
ncbi:MAG: hypothetical protein L0Y71_19995 [Gemmataceae bacterium]|nr:hypothetical protein [Gemmataceae bacterium]